MKHITLIFGHPKNIIIERLNLFDVLGNKLNAKIKKVSKFIYDFTYKNCHFRIRFCYNPKRDATYYDSKEYIKREFNDDVPIPSRDLIQKINSDIILFFGICGSTKQYSHIGDIFIPISTRKLYFRGRYITKKQLFSIKPSNALKTNNFLKGKIDGKLVEDLTTNITAFDENLKDLTREEYENKIKNYADVVQKELYEIVFELKSRKNAKFGAILICSDTPKEKFKPKHNFKFKKSYLDNIIKVIKIIADLRNSSEAFGFLASLHSGN